MQLSHRVIADFAQDAIDRRLLDVRKVIEWADSLIATEELLPLWMIDLSLLNPSDHNAVCEALRNVPGMANREQSDGLVTALVLREWRIGHLTIGEVRGIGWRLYQRSHESKVCRWGVVIECEGEFLDDGNISEQRMRESIDENLAFAADIIAQLPEWV